MLAAGFPEHVPGTTIDRQCGSSQQAATFAAQAVLAGQADIVIACGVESMSRVPLGSSAAGADPYGSRIRARYPDGLVNQGVSAELIAEKWGFTRDELDEFAARSHRLAAAAGESGAFATELVPVAGVDSLTDETVRPATSVDSLAGPEARVPHRRARRAIPRARLARHAGQFVAAHRRGIRRPDHERRTRRRSWG